MKLDQDVGFHRIDSNNWFINLKLDDNTLYDFWYYVAHAQKKRSELNGLLRRSLKLEDTFDYVIGTIFKGLLNSDLNDVIMSSAYKKLSACDINFEHKVIVPKLKELWVNFQQQYEVIPLHDHTGLFSFVIWMKIPYSWEDEAKLAGDRSYTNQIGNFVFVDSNLKEHVIQMSPEMEGQMIIFPSHLHHMVYPFYTTDKERTSISGNIFFDIKDNE